MEYGLKTRIAKYFRNIIKRKLFLIYLLLLLLATGYPIQSAANEFIITINTSRQELFVFQGKEIIRIYPVSTSRYGVGNKKNSNRTPLGTHFIVVKIGKDAKSGTIFEHRKNTGRIAEIYTDTTHIKEELITTRILWLKGIVPGLNEGGEVDSYTRYIYIHGTPEEGLIGTPVSNGCIRMKNQDIIELFDLVPEGTLVGIHE
jgi:lipoprotein-anchoring transpeptidase ErfK/SrfK